MAFNLRIKSVEQSISDTNEPDAHLRKSLTWWDLTVFGISVVLGAGIFTVTASTFANITGPAIWLSFLIAAATCALAVLCYAEFASTLPVAGSAYTYSYATFGEVVAWIIGWDLLIEYAVGSAVVAKGWSSYLGTVFPFIDGRVSIGSLEFDWGALVVIGIATVLLTLGTKLSSNVSAAITAIKVAIVLVVIAVGTFYFKIGNFLPVIPPVESGQHQAGSRATQSLFSLLTGAESGSYGWFGVLAGASILFFAFIGFDAVSTAAEETKNPQRDVVRGILTPLVIVTILYVAVAVVLSGMVRYSDLRDYRGGDHVNLATAFEMNGVHWAAGLISLGALAGLTTGVMVMMLGQTRILFAMARDGLLPHGLTRTGARGTPVRITVLVALLVASAAAFFPMAILEEMVNVGTLSAFVLVAGGILVLRRTRPDLRRSFRVPLVPALPIASILASVWLMLNLSVLTWVRFIIWMAAGTIIYMLYGRRNSVVGQGRPLEVASRGVA